MRSWLRSRIPPMLAFLAIAALVTGGLGWVTAAVVRLEREQVEARAEAERFAQLRPVMWQLDSRIAPILAREDSRPFNHYSAVYPPALLYANDKNGSPVMPGTVLEPSTLLNEELPEWMLLHFQTDVEHGWASPQVLSQRLVKILENPKARAPLDNVTDTRCQLHLRMAGCINPNELMSCVKQRSDQQRWVTEQPSLPAPNAAPQTANQLPISDDQVTKGTIPSQVLIQNGQQAVNPRFNFNNDFGNRAYQLEQNKKDMAVTKSGKDSP